MKILYKILNKLFLLLKKILKLLTSRVVVIAAALILEFLWIVVIMFKLNERSVYITYVSTIIALLMVFYIVNQRMNPGYKLMWSVCILAFPVMGICLYGVFGHSKIAHRFRETYDKVLLSQGEILLEKEETRSALSGKDSLIASQSEYLDRYANAPVYQNTETEYYPMGEDWFARFLEELEKAEHYIFLEYFIISEGYMWDTILEILKKKAQNGVDVRLIYDDFGCVTTLPYQYYKALQSIGIKCAAFNQFRPVLNVVLNNRDHRKIAVIDGHTGFTGGINLADEYINQKERFGHWKDSGVCLHGEAVWSFTVMFLQLWSAITRTDCVFEDYRPEKYHKERFLNDGFVQPYGDSPFDDETVGEHVYLNLISHAKRYLYIFTPYLIPDNETLIALTLAAKRGVDVRIVTPGIPDKKMVFVLTQSYYEQLIEAGVQIYQYTPGFIHSKCFVCDDEVATVGTINVDYRSMYLHFECGVWMYQSKAVMQVKEDALDTFPVCEQINMDFCRKKNFLVRALRGILKLLAPLL
ncbi:MAG: cardiolipin synthase [Fusicatenibacter sp.]|nr:cardiolipin synthase [Fusicatenibacter sp.]